MGFVNALWMLKHVLVRSDAPITTYETQLSQDDLKVLQKTPKNEWKNVLKEWESVGMFHKSNTTFIQWKPVLFKKTNSTKH
jgi:hypothetical protein